MALRLRRAVASLLFRSSHSRKQLIPSSTHLLSTTITTSTPTTPFSQPTRPFTSSSALFFSSRSRAFDPNIDEIGPDTILFEGCDYNHWLITIDFPKDQNLTREQMIDYYVNTAAQIFGSVEEAKKKIYALSTTTYRGFQVECSEETSEKFKNLPGVVFVLPDSYIDPVNKEYGGDKYINGEIIPRPPPVHYGRRPNRDRRPREEMSYQRGNWPPHNNNDQSPPPQQNGPPPQQRYGPPQQQNYGPPPQQNYGPPPQQNYGPPPQQHNYGPPPQQNYGPPPQQQNYGPPRQQQSYGPPPQQQSYGPPPQQQNYGPPPQQQNYGPPPQQRSYGPPQQQNYGPPPQQRNYGPPQQQNYGPPPQQQNYGPPPQNYGPPQHQSHRPPPQQSYNQPPDFQSQQSHSPATEGTNYGTQQGETYGQASGGQGNFSSTGNK